MHKNRFSSSCIIFILILQSFYLQAQVSTIGNEFWVGFMDNNRGPGAPDFANLIITATEPAQGSIDYLGRTANFDLEGGEQFLLRVPSEDLDLLHRTSATVENKGIYISSSGKIAVHAYNERFRSADGTVVLPVNALGTDYYITSHYEDLTATIDYPGNSDDESTLLVIAVEDNTEVEITPTEATYGGGLAGVPITITLQQGQSYQLKSKGDLTGTRVRSLGDNNCQKIAVFGGNKWTSVGNCGAANDHLFQQAYPVNTWGSSFVHVALSGRTSGELVKVLAAEDGTEVRVNGTLRGSIDSGEFLTLEFGINQHGKIETSKAASVTMFSKSQACNQPNSPDELTGDPFMITYSPSEQFLDQVTFVSLNLPSIVNHYVNIVVRTGTENETFLDGQAIGGRFFALPGDPSFSYARVNISQGVHRLTNPEGFAAFVYGFGNLESYGYSAGAALNNLNFEIESSYDFEVVGEKVACLDQEATWVIEPENPDFTYFLWDFGDGTDLKEGPEVMHTYAETGNYEVKVLAGIGPNSCDQQEDISFEVEVVDFTGEISGLESVCPDVEELLYTFDFGEGTLRAEFEVNGGELVSATDSTALIRWGPANDAAYVRAIGYGENGCPGTPVDFPVIINQRLDAEIPEGPDRICFDPSITQIYHAPNPSPGREYAWEVEGGELVSGQGSAEIEVRWTEDDSEGRLNYTVRSLVDSSCEGISDFLIVRVDPEFILEVDDLEMVDCFGNSTGHIFLRVAGGVPPYQIEWAHDPGINTDQIENIPAGEYSVIVTDAVGCERRLDALEITEPALLEVTSVSPQQTSCFGRTDGEVSLVVQGGTPPYTVDYEGVDAFSGSYQVTDLPRGTYEWELVDANGCSLPIAFEISSPPPLEVDVRMELPTCPGGSTGALLATPEGGQEPFLFVWEGSTQTGALLTDVGKGIYAVTVTDRDGCEAIGSGEVLEKEPQIRMPNALRLDDGILFQGVSNCPVDFELWIYNRWGELIYQGVLGWDGRLENGEFAQTGTYSYLVTYQYTFEEEMIQVSKRGGFLLLR